MVRSIKSTRCLLEPSPPGQNTLTPIDISRGTNLKNVTFRCESWDSAWVVLTLKTITPEHRNLRCISLDIPFTNYDITDPEDRKIVDWYEKVNPYTRWSEIDRILVQFSELHPIRLELSCPRSETKRRVKDLAEYLFPEMTRRKIVDFVEKFSGSL